MSRFRTLLLGATVLGLSTGTQAQPNSSEIEEITVSVRRPMAESVAAALEMQRNSDSLVSVLSADAIGNLPDQNIAFAVGRLPGVGIERDQGQARYVNLRGAPNYWTTLSREFPRFSGHPELTIQEVQNAKTRSKNDLQIQ